MTREEAIEIVKSAFSAWESEFRVPNDDWSEEHEALDMAIEALKQVTGKLNNPDDSFLTADPEACKEQKSKLDLISRAEAIEAVRLETGMRGLLGRGDILEILLSLPSADAVSREDYHNLLMASNDIDRALREYQAKDENQSSEAVQGVGRYENATQKLRELPRYINGVKVRRIEKMPTKADTVEVVRCKDCKYAEHREQAERVYCHRERLAISCPPRDDDDFCKYGERRY